MGIVKNDNRQFKLGMHSYTLHLNGCRESWGFEQDYAFEKTVDLTKMMDLAVEWGLDVLHITLVDLDNDVSAEHLAEVKTAARSRGLDLELNVSINAPCDPRVNASVEEALHIGDAIGAQLVKFSLDIKRPKPIYGSCMHPDVVVQLADPVYEFKKNIPLIENYGMKVALENHCDLFADEVIWLVEQLHHPLRRMSRHHELSCADGVEECVKKMAPYAYCCHFCDINIVVDADGTHSIGTPIGQGDIDCVMIMQELPANAPEAIDTIVFEIEMPLNGRSIEEGRELELRAAKESSNYMRSVLNVGH
jgi:3-oxoisoapionate decarboxylase